MKRIVCMTTVVALACLIAVTAIPKAKVRAGGCSVETLNGNYGATVSGTIVGVGLGAAVGLAAFDGKGGVSIESTQSTNGEISRVSDAGTYTVNSNCTGSSTLSSGGTAEFVVVSEGKEIQIIQTIPGTIIIGTAKKQ